MSPRSSSCVAVAYLLMAFPAGIAQEAAPVAPSWIDALAANAGPRTTVRTPDGVPLSLPAGFREVEEHPGDYPLFFRESYQDIHVLEPGASEASVFLAGLASVLPPVAFSESGSHAFVWAGGSLGSLQSVRLADGERRTLVDYTAKLGKWQRGRAGMEPFPVQYGPAIHHDPEHGRIVWIVMQTRTELLGAIMASAEDWVFHVVWIEYDGKSFGRLGQSPALSGDPRDWAYVQHTHDILVLLAESPRDLMVLDGTDGTEKGRMALSLDRDASHIALSPDQRTLAVTLLVDKTVERPWRGNGGVVLVDLATRAVTRVSEIGYYVTWSPESRFIAYLENVEEEDDAQRRLSVYDRETGKGHVILSREETEEQLASAHYFAGPAWSPDGETIAVNVGNVLGRHPDHEDLVTEIIDVHDRTIMFLPTYATFMSWGPRSARQR